MKITSTLLTILALALLITAGCQPAAPAKPFRVAAVMPSAADDSAFSQSMVDALTAIQTERGEGNFEFTVSENMFVVDDGLAAIRDYASQDYDLIIAHGSQYGAGLARIAPEFPEVSFAWGTTADTFSEQGITNVFAYEAHSEQGGYVNGVMAAMLSKSGVIGVIAPIEAGDAELYVEGFTAGVLATNPKAEVRVTYTGSFSDTALAAEAANAHIEAGADVLTGSAQMVVGAISVAQKSGVIWFGTQSDQSMLASDIVVASQVYHWEVVLSEMIDLIKDGTTGGKVFQITLENGGEAIEYNERAALPDDVKSAAESAIQAIKEGTITIDIPTK